MKVLVTGLIINISMSYMSKEKFVKKRKKNT